MSRKLVNGIHLLIDPQLEEAKRDHGDAKRKAEGHSDSVRRKAQTFQQEQDEIERKLLVVTQSSTSDDAVERFEESMESLRKLDVAMGYIELIQEVDTLKSECTSQLGKSDREALEPYRRLQQLVANLQPLQEAAEGAAPHLLDHIGQQVQGLRQAIQKSFSTDLEQTLKKMNWPKAMNTVPLALQKEWESNFGRLLDLQRQDLEDWERRGANRSPNDEPPVLLPLEVMVHPLEQRFTYHFSGNKATNRLDKPEYFLSHTTELVSTYSEFLQNAVQPLLAQHFRGSDLAFTPAYIDATSAFITALLPMLRRKLSSFAHQVSNQPHLLSHLVHEVMAFDTTLQESFEYSPISPSLPWRGLAYYLLDSCGYFQQWLFVERDFALARYQSIIDSAEAGELDYDSVAADATKPMKAAIRLNDLLETITDRYRPLSSFSQKIRFLIDIQINIFDRFQVRLRESLDAYVTMNSTIARTVPGVSREGQSEVQGIKGLDRLCRVFGSAEYLERAMRDWSDDVFFLQLYEELQERLKIPERQNRNLVDLHEVQKKANSGANGEAGDGELHGALFDETAGLYHHLRVRSEGMIVQTLTHDIRDALRPYGGIGTWASLSSSSAGGAVSAELDPTLSVLNEYLGFLSKAIGRISFRRMARQLCHSISDYIWDNVLIRHSFSTAGATQLSADIAAISSRIDRYVGSGQAQLGMRRLLEGATLISLPVRSEIQRVRPSSSGDDDDEDFAWEETNGNAEKAKDEKIGLFEVDRLIFKDNESARRVLQQLGIESLSEHDAREVLKKRVELRS